MLNSKKIIALMAGLSLAIIVKAEVSTQPAVDQIKRIAAVENTMQTEAPKPAGVFSKNHVNLYGKFNLGMGYGQYNGDHKGGYVVRPIKEGNNVDTRNKFNMNLKLTRLGFDITLPEIFGNPAKGKIEADFNGSDSSDSSKFLFRLRHAYVNWENQSQWGVLVGQTWLPMMAEAPDTIHPQGLASAGSIVDIRAVQVAVSKGFDGVFAEKGKLRTKVGLVNKQTEDENKTGTMKDDKGNLKSSKEKAIAPHVQWNICYKYPLLGNKRTRLSFSGTFGKNSYTGGDLNGQHQTSWATIGSLRLPIVNWLSLTGSLGTGANLKGWNEGGINQSVNATDKKAIRSFFGWAQVSIVPPQYRKVSLNAGLGFDSVRGADLVGSAKEDANRKRNVAYFANVSYEITKSSNVGIEYMHQRTHYKENALGSGYAHSVYGSFNYLF